MSTKNILLLTLIFSSKILFSEVSYADKYLHELVRGSTSVILSEKMFRRFLATFKREVDKGKDPCVKDESDKMPIDYLDRLSYWQYFFGCSDEVEDETPKQTYSRRNCMMYKLVISAMHKSKAEAGFDKEFDRIVEK